jgi:hypothetical protein
MSYFFRRNGGQVTIRRRLKLHSLVLLAGFLLMSTARADYWWNYLDVSCQPNAQKVSINVKTLWNEDIDLKWHGTIRPQSNRPEKQEFLVTSQIDYGECFISPGKQLRIKVSDGKAMPYGMCGGNPETWVSLWVDKRKLLSQYQVAGRCTTTPASRIEISLHGIVLCTKEADSFGEVLSNAKESCETMPAAILPEQIDRTEYPTSQEKRQEAGTIVIEHGKKAALCEGMINRNQTQFGRPAWTVDIPSDADSDLSKEEDHGLYDYAGHFSKNRFDFYNDGDTEIVYGFHPANHAHDADIYFLSPGEEFDKKWPKISDADLWKSSPYVFPNSLGNCQNHPCGKNDEDGYFVLQDYSEHGNHVAYRFRYLHVTPFVWQGTTYFLLTSLDSISEHISSVVKPMKRERPEEICIFRTVLGNF